MDGCWHLGIWAELTFEPHCLGPETEIGSARIRHAWQTLAERIALLRTLSRLCIWSVDWNK